MSKKNILLRAKVPDAMNAGCVKLKLVCQTWKAGAFSHITFPVVGCLINQVD